MQDIVNLTSYEKSAMALGFVLCLCLVVPCDLQTAYGLGTAIEAVETMEVSQQVDNGASQPTPRGPAGVRRPAQDANAATEPPDRRPDGMRGRPNPADTTAQPDLNERAPAATDAETPTAAPAVTADTNVPDVNDFNAFKQEIVRIDIEARGEDAQWLGKQDKKAELAKAMDDVIVAELRFLRKVAAAANDANTVEAIDLVLEKRRDRLNKLVTKLENELREDRKQQAGERQQRRATRTGTGGQEQPQTPRSTNPVRRTRETINQEQQ